MTADIDRAVMDVSGRPVPCCSFQLQMCLVLGGMLHVVYDMADGLRQLVGTGRLLDPTRTALSMQVVQLAIKRDA